MIQAYNANDLPVILGVVVFSTLAVIIFNLIVDLHLRRSSTRGSGSS